MLTHGGSRGTPTVMEGMAGNVFFSTSHYAKPGTDQPGRYLRRRKAFASLELVNFALAPCHCRVVFGKRVARGPNRTASVKGPEKSKGVDVFPLPRTASANSK